MDVYIDNIKMDIKNQNYSNFGMAIAEIGKALMKENKIMENIMVNGEELKEHSVIGPDDLQLIEITTRSYGGIILEALGNARDYIDNYFKILDSFYDTEDEDVLEVDENELVEINLFLKWFYDLLLTIKDNGIFDFIYEDFDQYIEDFHVQLIELEKLYNSGKIEELIEQMNFSLNDFLADFYDNIEEYLGDVIQEEKQKILIN